MNTKYDSIFMLAIRIIIIVAWFTCLTLVLLESNPARADDISVYVASQHITSTGTRFNQINPGLGYGSTVSEHTDVITGAYYNSFKRISVYGGFRFHTNTPLEAGVELGLVTGYQYSVVPMASTYLKYSVIKANLLPVVERDELTGAAIGLSFNFDL